MLALFAAALALAGTPLDRCVSSAADAGASCAAAYADESVGLEVYVYASDAGATAGVAVKGSRGWIIVPVQLPEAQR